MRWAGGFMSQQVLDYIAKNKNHFLESLKQIIRLESISAQPAKKDQVLKCADLETKILKEIGLENVQLIHTGGYPLVYGDWIHAPGKPTILIYGHYDVQPPEPLDLWKTPPFEPTIIGDNLYARGSSDNKGQHFSHLCAMEAYLKTVGKLPVNIKVVLEGEEEVGGGGIDKYVREHGKFLACDAVMISDTDWFDSERPAISYSLKGLCYFEINVTGPSHDLHSGLYGGMIRNPLQALSWILSKLKNEKEEILIPGFYDDVKPIASDERKDIADLPFDDNEVAKGAGASQLISEGTFSPVETNWCRPTLDICGMWGGYEGVGSKTIIPSKAGAKVSIRLVANQDPKKIEKMFVNYVKSLATDGVKVEVHTHSSGIPFHVERENFFVQKTAKAYETALGKKMVFKRLGASIPIAAVFQSVLKVPVVLIGLGLPDDRVHSPNEKMSLPNFFDGIKGAALAYEAFAEKA